MAIEFRVLGPLEVYEGGRPLRLGGAKQRAFLAILLLHANRVVSVETLIDELWGDEPPETALKSIHNVVSRLRKLLEPDEAGRTWGQHQVLVTRPPGYMLRLEPGQLDAERFEGLAQEGRRALEAGRPEAGANKLREALELWRGPALADLRDDGPMEPEIARLEELRITAVEDLVEAELELGRHADLVPKLRTLIGAEPFRERLRGQLILALYRSGRQVEALEAYQETRRFLIEHMGIEPSRALQRLQQAILWQEPSLELPSPHEASRR